MNRENRQWESARARGFHHLRAGVVGHVSQAQLSFRDTEISHCYLATSISFHIMHNQTS